MVVFMMFVLVVIMPVRRVIVIAVGVMIVSVIVMLVAMMIVMIMATVGAVHVNLLDLGAGVGAALRVKRRLDAGDLGAEPTRHFLDDGVATDADAIGEDLHRQVAIAKMPREAREVARFADANFRKLLGRGDDLDQPSVLQHQRVAAAQHDGFRQIEQEFEPMRARHGDAAAMPLVEIEHDRVGRLGLPGALGADEIRSDHGAVPACPRRKALAAIQPGVKRRRDRPVNALERASQIGYR